MNKLSILLFIGVSVLLNKNILAQTFDFEEGKIPDSWIGNRDHFQISASNQLQLNAPVGSTTSSLAWLNMATANCKWEFAVNYAFAASTTNYAIFYLFSTGPDFTTATNVAYYLKIGGAAGSVDKIELIYQQGTSKQVILESKVGVVGGSNVECRIQVNKDASGRWELKTDSKGGYDFTVESSAKHWIDKSFKYSGLRCLYSSTRRDKFSFDDIFIREPFSILRHTFESDSILKVFFNQPLDVLPPVSIDVNFGAPYTTAIHDSYLQITFSKRIESDTYIGTIRNLFSDRGDLLENNYISITKEATYYVGQLRISEMMSDPTPSYGLPEAEWIELINITEQAVNLNGFSISDPSSKVKLPNYLLLPDSVVIVCASNLCKNFLSKNCIEVATLPSLNNSSDSIFVWANDTLLIDFVTYDLATLPKDYRSDGGYSIIRKEFPNECFLSQQLDFSNNVNGGTPGTISNIQKQSKLKIDISVNSAKEICVDMNTIAKMYNSYFTTMQQIQTLTESTSLFSTRYLVNLTQALEKGYLYEFTIDSMRTCRNKVIFINAKTDLIYPKEVDNNDVFINEVLYDPYSGGVDFIEVYNNSSVYVQLKGTHLYNSSSGKVQHLYLSDNIIINPWGYATLTSDTTMLKQGYPTTVNKTSFQVLHFLSLPNTGGELIFLNAKSDTLDKINYGDIYHNSLHRDSEGYSLEKISSAESYFYSANWTTSATHATPGYVNSQQKQSNNGSQKTFHCEPCHVSTNLNGINDFALLFLSDKVQGCFGTVGIYRLSGEKVKDIVVNQLLGSVNVFQWNGDHQNGSILEDGIYVAVAEWWSSDGKSYISKIAISTSFY